MNKNQITANSAWLAIAMPVIGMLALACVWCLGSRDSMLTRLLQLSPAPLMFLLWLKIVEKEQPGLYRKPAWGMVLVSILGFCLAIVLESRAAVTAMMLIGVGAGLFVMVDFGQVARLLGSHLKLSFVLLMGSLSCAGYFLGQAFLWSAMCKVTAWLMEGMVRAFTDIPINVTAMSHRIVHHAVVDGQVTVSKPVTAEVITIASQHFALRLYPPCSGLEGVFLVYFLLSVMILIDWNLFSPRRLLEYYAVAFVYMFFLNALRIAAFFLVGDWAWRPDASAFAIGFREWPLMMFHTWVGWVVYLSAFLLFAAVIYIRLMRTPRHY